MEYPKGSGKFWKFPEVDRVEFLSLEEAKIKLRPQQAPLLDRLKEKLPLSILSRSSKGCASFN